MVSLENYPAPEHGIRHTENNVTATVGAHEIGLGTLYITESVVLWRNQQGHGVELEYRQICLHAVSRDLHAFPKEHLLCHYEGKISGLSHPDDERNEDDDEVDSVCETTEIRFAPENKDSLEAMFQALAACQTLHPDSDCQLSDENEEDYEDAEEDSYLAAGDAVIYDSEEGLANLTPEGRATMERLNQMLQRQAGAGDGSSVDADIARQAGNMNISNGHQMNGEAPMDADQFDDAEDAQ